MRCEVTTAAGYDGRDPNRGRLIEAMGTLASARVTLRQSIADDELVISTSKVELTFTRDGLV
jgi:hypothetical protein